MSGTQLQREERKAGARVFHGWWITLVAAIGLLTSYPPMVIYPFTIYLAALSQEFNWSRSETSLGFSLASLAAIVCSPFVGRVVDRVGARKVIVVSMLILGGALISLYPLSGRLWHFYGVYLVLGAVGTGTTSVPFSRVISRWFDKRRGFALGFINIGTGSGALLMPFLAQSLISHASWRTAYLTFGLMVIASAVFLVAPFLEETPRKRGLLPDGGKLDHLERKVRVYSEDGVSGRTALRGRTFWIMVVAFFLIAVSVQGCLIHFVPLLRDRGVSPRSAALAVSLLGGATLLGRITTGYLLDRFFAPRVAFCLFLGAALGMVILLAGAAGILGFVAAFLIGFGLGAETDIMPYIVSRYFGLSAFGEIYGYVFTTFPIGAAIGPLLMGISFDKTGSYRPMLAAFVMAILVSAGLMILLRPYPKWETTQAS